MEIMHHKILQCEFHYYSLQIVYQEARPHHHFTSLTRFVLSGLFSF